MTLKNILILVAGVLLLVILVVAVRLFLIKRSISIYQDYWTKQAEASVSEDDFIYIALGDSTAQGIGASKPQNGYVGLVANYLGEKTGKNIHIINISKSGAKISDAINEQIPKLKDLPKPDLITIEIGANDIVGYEKQKFESEFNQLLMLLPEQTVVANIPSFSKGLQFMKASESTEASNIASKLISDSESNHLADVYNHTQNLGLFDFAADLFHPSDRAYQKWADAFIEAINSNDLINNK